MEQREAWGRRYREEAGLWRGRARPLPELPRGSRVLDAGCGNGKGLLAMAERGWRVTGVDFSDEAVRLCETALGRRGLSAELLVADATELPFDDATFDAVVATHLLGHLLEAGRRKAAAELARVAMPGGGLYARVFSRGDMRFGRGKEMEPATFERGNGIIVHYFEAGELARLLEPHARPGSLAIETERGRQLVDGKRLVREELAASCAVT